MNKMVIAALLLFAAFLSVAAFFAFSGNETDCPSFSYPDCPERCVVCPPCAVCSSISCQSEEFCRGLGFDRNWYAAIEEKLE